VNLFESPMVRLFSAMVLGRGLAVERKDSGTTMIQTAMGISLRAKGRMMATVP
jgi:hypothetical protein